MGSTGAHIDRFRLLRHWGKSHFRCESLVGSGRIWDTVFQGDCGVARFVRVGSAPLLRRGRVGGAITDMGAKTAFPHRGFIRCKFPLYGGPTFRIICANPYTSFEKTNPPSANPAIAAIRAQVSPLPRFAPVFEEISHFGRNRCISKTNTNRTAGHWGGVPRRPPLQLSRAAGALR